MDNDKMNTNKKWRGLICKISQNGTLHIGIVKPLPTTQKLEDVKRWMRPSKSR